MLLKDINLLKLAVGWLVFFTLICLTNSVLIIVYQLYDKGGGFAFFLPFIHYAIVFLGFATVSFTKGQTWKSEYICSNYPDIAQKIYPDYGQQNNSKKWIPKIFIGLLFVSFVGYTFYRPNHFKYAIVIWILIPILLPIIFLILGTIILAFCKFYLTLFEGKQVAEDFI